MARATDDDPRPEGSPASPHALGMSLVRIGDWDVDAPLNLLRRDAAEVRLEPKVMEVLVCLIGRAGEVVSRDALLATVWQGVVVGDDALTQAVIKLRKALGDDVRAPRYIQTVAKRGYRLVAPIGTPDPVGDPSPLARPPPVQMSFGRVRVWRWSAFAAAALGSMLVVEVALHRLSGQPQPVVDAVTASAIAPASSASASAPVPTSATARPIAKRPAVAVMPFDVLGDHPEQRYLARGLAAELAMDLSRISGLDVVPVDAATRSVAGAADRVAAAKFFVFAAS